MWYPWIWQTKSDLIVGEITLNILIWSGQDRRSFSIHAPRKCMVHILNELRISVQHRMFTFVYSVDDKVCVRAGLWLMSNSCSSLCFDTLVNLLLCIQFSSVCSVGYAAISCVVWQLLWPQLSFSPNIPRSLVDWSRLHLTSSHSHTERYIGCAVPSMELLSILVLSVY